MTVYKLILAAAAAATMGTAFVAHAEVTNPVVKERMATMSAIGAEVKTLTQMSKGQIDFDAAAAQAALTVISEKAATVPAVFEANETDPESDASPKIWENWDDFVAKAEALQTAAAAGAESVTDGASLGAAMGAVGGACGACHKEYKL